MAKDKKSVLLYCDIIHTVEELDDVDAGLLFKHYLRYINDQNPEPPSKLIKIVFEPIKQNLKRDLRKWEEKSQRNKEIAIEGWHKRKNANACERTKADAKHADIDTVIVTDTDTDKVTDTVTVTDKVTVTDTVTEKKKEDPLRAFLDLLSGDLKIAYAEWIQYRKELGKKITPSTAKKQIRFLGGRDPAVSVAIINQSISNGWTGLFELKQNGTTKTSKQEQSTATAEYLAKHYRDKLAGKQL